MRHFDKQQWDAFGRDMANPELQDNMEQHLLECEDCLQTFLLSIDETEINQATFTIPEDFASSMIKYINNRQAKLDSTRVATAVKVKTNSHSGLNGARMRSKRLFSYYVAAAAITLMLMGGGVFQSAIDQVSNVPATGYLQADDRQDSFLIKWPTQLKEKTTSWINTIQKEVK